MKHERDVSFWLLWQVIKEARLDDPQRRRTWNELCREVERRLPRRSRNGCAK